jgi:hypothetical protein
LAYQTTPTPPPQCNPPLVQDKAADKHLPFGWLSAASYSQQECTNNVIVAVGTKTAYAQQWHLLRQKGDLQPDPRKSFHKDLDNFLTPHVTAGNEILLLGDFNETLGESFQGRDALINKYALLDLLPYHHGIDGEIEMYSRGSKRLDYAFGTQTLAESTVRTGYTPYNFVITSDHRGLFMDNADSFLGGDPSQLMSHALRGIKSSDPQKCRKYVSAVNKYLTVHHVYARVLRLEKQTDERGFTLEIQKRWEKIDRDLLRACLYAESLTSCRDRPPWSPRLHQASMMVAFWKIKLSDLQTARECTNRLETLILHIDWGESPPLAAKFINICTKLRSAPNKIRTIRKQASTGQTFSKNVQQLRH